MLLSSQDIKLFFHLFFLSFFLFCLVTDHYDSFRPPWTMCSTEKEFNPCSVLSKMCQWFFSPFIFPVQIVNLTPLFCGHFSLLSKHLCFHEVIASPQSRWCPILFSFIHSILRFPILSSMAQACVMSLSFSICLEDPDPVWNCPSTATSVRLPNPQGDIMLLSVPNSLAFSYEEERWNIHEGSWLYGRRAVGTCGYSVYWAGLFSSCLPAGHSSMPFNWLRLSDIGQSHSKETSGYQTESLYCCFWGCHVM